MRITLLLLVLFTSINIFSQTVTADFSATPLALCVGDPVQFTDLSTAGASPIQTWNWDFGDGNSSNLQNPDHAFTLAGIYNITLTIQLVDGTSESEVKPAYVVVEDVPVSDFTLDAFACSVPFAATFNNMSSSGAGYTYSWDFGNGQVSSDYNPSGIVYNAPGNYIAELIVTSPGAGCSNSVQLNIDVIDFQAGMNVPDTICLTQTGQFQDASSASATEWIWDFGDGSSTSTMQNTVLTYLNAGSYTISLTASNPTMGCTSTITQTLVVLDVPTASFSVDDTYGCAPKDVTFTSSGLGGTQFNWDFGDGTTFNGEFPPVHTYIDSGEYFPSLVVSNDFGCSAIYYFPSSIQVGILPEPVFTIDTLSGCDTINVIFIDMSAVLEPGNDPIVDWSWDFGNGNTFNGQTPPSQGYGIGIFSPGLTITTQSGCQSSNIYVDTIAVGSIDTASFDLFSTVVCGSEVADALGSSTVSAPFSPGDVEYSWNFSDGTSAMGNPPMFLSASTTYSDTGNVALSMSATVQGCAYTVNGVDSIYVSGPIGGFEASDTLLCNPTLPFTLSVLDLSIIGKFSDDAQMTWDWGDGTSTNLTNADLDDANQGSEQHIYNSYGTFTIDQTITNNTTGCSSTNSTEIILSYIDASQDFALWGDTVCLGASIQIDTVFSSDIFQLSDTINNFYSMGDGINYFNPIDTTFLPLLLNLDTTHLYNNWGTYEVIHGVSNLFGCVDIDTMEIVVIDNPTAEITADVSSGCAPLVVNFDNTSIPNNNGAPIVSMEWIYPDGTTLNTTDINQAGTFTFYNEGSFQTILNIEDANGCTATAASETEITKPAAQFFLDSVVCDLEDFTAISTTVGDEPLSFSWLVDGVLLSNTDSYTGQFNDGATNSGLITSHDMSLVVIDVNGCIDTVSNTVLVSLPQASANYSLSGASVNEFGEFTCPPVFATFTDSSESYGQVVNWEWDFGNGNSSTLEDPQNTYVFAGTYTVTLNIEDQFGCTSDSVFTDFLNIMGPSANPGWTNIGEFCDPEIQFYAENQNGVTNIDWDFGGLNNVNDTSSFVHVYDLAGTYNVNVILSDDDGCQVPYLLDPITIFYADIDAFFTSSMSEGQVTEPFVFDDQSTSTLSNIVSWDWDFSTGSISNNTDQDVDFFWETPGEQTITLTVSDTNGCSESYQLQVLISADFTIPNVFTPNADEVNDFFSLDFDAFNGYDFVIVNRWGNVVMDGNDVTGTKMWDGNNKQGEECAEGVYFYKFIGNFYDGTSVIKHGNVTLIR